MLWPDSLVSSCRDFRQRLTCSQFLLLLFTPAGFMQNSSSTIFQIFPSGSHQASSLATLSSLKTPLTSASSTFMSPITGKSLSHTHTNCHTCSSCSYTPLSIDRCEVWVPPMLCYRSLNVDMEWLYGASESSNMEVDIGYLPQVWLFISTLTVLIPV